MIWELLELEFLLPDSSVWARRSTAYLSTPNCFSLRRRIACTLPFHHELASTPFNVLVAFPPLTTIVERPIFHLAMDFTIDNSLVVLRWTKCTPRSQFNQLPIINFVTARFRPLHQD